MARLHLVVTDRDALFCFSGRRLGRCFLRSPYAWWRLLIRVDPLSALGLLSSGSRSSVTRSTAIARLYLSPQSPTLT